MSSLLRFRYKYFETPTDKGGGGGAGDSDKGKSPDKKDDDTPADKSKDDGKKDGPNPEFTQDDLNKLAAKVRAEEKAKYEKQLADDKKAAEDAALAEQGKFKELAESLQKKVDELTTKSSSIEAVSNYVAKLIEEEIKDWDKELLESDPGKDDISLRLAWYEKFKPLAKRLKTTPPSIENGGKGTAPKDFDPLKGYMDPSRYGVPSQNKS